MGAYLKVYLETLTSQCVMKASRADRTKRILFGEYFHEHKHCEIVPVCITNILSVSLVKTIPKTHQQYLSYLL